MKELFLHLIFFNLSLSVFYLIYLVLYRKDKAFRNRRYYLLLATGVSLLLPFARGILPVTTDIPFIIHYDLEEVMITSGATRTDWFNISARQVLQAFYLVITMFLFGRLFLQLTGIAEVVRHAPMKFVNGMDIYISKELHGSSFFNKIFIDTERCNDEEVRHIWKHERAHAVQFHSADRLLMEFILILNWFNPLLWFMRNSVIENHEYLADSAVIGEGTDVFNYQLSILNQCIGSASVINQFSSQIKKRIKMINTKPNHKGQWKILFLLPVALFALVLFSCVEKNETSGNLKSEEAVQTDEIFTEIEEMPLFNGEDSPNAFRKYIAVHLIYPAEAVSSGTQGKILIHFVITSKGDVRLATPAEVSKTEDQPIDEVVVVAYEPKDQLVPNEKAVESLKKEAERVVLSSAGMWTAGKNDGKNVSTMFTFPITFLLQ